jgi:hypothetical protein
MYERRQLPRHIVDRHARIGFGDQPSRIDCTVRDLTNRGACLELATASQPPDSFELSFDNFRTARHCRIAWRQADRLGVAFC